MANPDSIALAAKAETGGLPVVLVGGNAVNLHGYSRTTFDLDLLVREADAEDWLSFFQQNGYDVFHRTPNFIRLRLSADPAGALPVDLMLADERTFEIIHQESGRQTIDEGVSLPIPKPLHLIAMKLHALKSALRREHAMDFQDVIHLIKTANIDTASNEFAELVERYGTEEIRARILRELGEKRHS